VPERNTEDTREIIVNPYRIVCRLRPELVQQTRGGVSVGCARFARAS
jgi:hypothetical protein